MSEMNADWDDLKLFLAVARNRGLSGAARETGSSAPTLGRRMQALEATTGLELFHRHARGYDLTEQGEVFFQNALEIEAAIRPLVTPPAEDQKRLVKISAGAWTLRALSQEIAQITRAAPDALLRFISDDAFLNINHRETVIGIRNQRPHQQGLACRKIADVSFAGYASTPDVTGWIRVTSTAPSSRWLAAQPEAHIVMEANTSHLARDLAVQGAGRVLLPCFIGDKDPGLVQVHPPVPELDHEQWLVSHHEDRFIPAVRQVLEGIYAAMQRVHRGL